MGSGSHEVGRIDERGRLVVPRAWREELGLRPGDAVLMESDGTEIRIVNARRDREALLARLRGSVTAGGSVDQLIESRRAEAAVEAGER
jgi:AbrB family looped-hinge helix DNA binding protein